MTQTAAVALQESRAAVARACKAGDVLAEQFARRQLLAWKVADALNRAQESGLRFTPDEERDWKTLIVELAAGRSGAPTSGADAVARLQDAVLAAGNGTCDRCGAAVASVSASMDLTGTEQPPLVLERLCPGCRGYS
jgi:hypothetical protein